ncbi:hypothetical protein [Hyphomicrobium sp. 99]|uniref:hypothetical protein n=1 Tax=Hyphomicrobium sp. 99 TaxID=1163419 RepID=UPI0005F7CA25|nr:hypothetical protein [Hyphomicrobium sp. 99]
MDPADLNDPATAEAFVRESIADLTETIAKFEAAAEQKIQGYRKRFPANSSLLLDLYHSVREELRETTADMRMRRNLLLGIIERVESTRRHHEPIRLGEPISTPE